MVRRHRLGPPHGNPVPCSTPRPSIRYTGTSPGGGGTPSRWRHFGARAGSRTSIDVPLACHFVPGAPGSAPRPETGQGARSSGRYSGCDQQWPGPTGSGPAHRRIGTPDPGGGRWRNDVAVPTRSPDRPRRIGRQHPDHGRTGAARSHRRGAVKSHGMRWVAVAALVAMIGVAGSVLGSQAAAKSAASQSRQIATTSSLEIAANLTLAIQREQDLAVSAATFLTANPNATMAQFRQWADTGRVFSRFPEIQGLADVVIVSEADLPAYASRSEADPAGTLGPGGTFQVTPPGSRPFYCFESVTQSWNNSLVTPAGLDLCATSLGPTLLTVRDTGQGGYLPYGTGSNTQLVVGTPIYAGGVVPTTVAARRAAFLGWTGTQIDPAKILDVPLATHPDTAVVFRYHQGGIAETIRAGKAPSGAQSSTIDLHNGWQVDVLTAHTRDSVVENPTALAILVTGIALSLLLALLVYVLGTSRSRALLLVDERTDQLRHQALHDALTGLPNRALILDRLGQMLAQSRRRPMPLAVLFLDLDDFKDINDTLGHRAGDELLVHVAGRLQVAIREGDTVGRLGGDEFVVLTGASAPDSDAADAAMVAERILGVLAKPMKLAASDVPVSVSASIG